MRDDSLEDWLTLPPSPGSRENDKADGEVRVFCEVSKSRPLFHLCFEASDSLQVC